MSWPGKVIDRVSPEGRNEEEEEGSRENEKTTSAPTLATPRSTSSARPFRNRPATPIEVAFRSRARVPASGPRKKTRNKRKNSFPSSLHSSLRSPMR